MWPSVGLRLLEVGKYLDRGWSVTWAPPQGGVRVGSGWRAEIGSTWVLWELWRGCNKSIRLSLAKHPEGSL